MKNDRRNSFCKEFVKVGYISSFVVITATNKKLIFIDCITSANLTTT
jgi:hypothetical protein